jgi:hypothetical protein
VDEIGEAIQECRSWIVRRYAPRSEGARRRGCARIDFLKGRSAPQVARLRALLGRSEIIIGDLMLCEVLQGLDDERAARDVESLLRRFEIVPMAGDAIPVNAARISVCCAGEGSPCVRQSIS